MNPSPYPHQGSITGRMTSSAPAFQSLSKTPRSMAQPEDTDLLDRLAQPTAYARMLRRRRALNRYIVHSTTLVRLRLGGSPEADAMGELVESYRTMYKFTEEEINASIEATHPGAEA